MAARSNHAGEDWNVARSLKLLTNKGAEVRQEKCHTLESASRNYRRLAEAFHRQAGETAYRSALSDQGVAALQQEIVSLTDWIRSKEQRFGCDDLKNVVPFKICLLMLVRYLLCKTRSRSLTQRLYWAANSTKLALEVALHCYDDQNWKDLEFCLHEAVAYDSEPAFSFCKNDERFAGDVQLRVARIRNAGLLFVVRLLWSASQRRHRDALRLLAGADSVELTDGQRRTVARICYNVGMEHWKARDHDQAFVWLKICHRLDGRAEPSPLILLAACLYHQGVASNRDLIVDLLRRAGDTVMNRELELRTLLSTKTSNTIVVASAMGYWDLALKQSVDVFRTSVVKVLVTLEQQEQLEILGLLLERLPWNEERAPDGGPFAGCQSGVWIAIRWTCAKLAIHCCLKNRYLIGCYEWLSKLVQWRTIDNSDDAHYLRAILTAAEAEALRFYERRQTGKTVRWYALIAKILQRHGGLEPSVLSNGIRCCLEMFQPPPISTDLQFFVDAAGGVAADRQLMRWQLLVAVFNEDRLKAIETSVQLNSNQAAEHIQAAGSADWKTAVQLLEKSTALALKGNMSDVAVHCLGAIMDECNRAAVLESWFHSIKIHLKILFGGGVRSPMVEMKCIDNLISSLISSYLRLKEDLSLDDQLDSDSGGLELRLANLAWDLGFQVKRSSPFYRHQLFKLSYKLYDLTADRDQSITALMEMSLLLSVAAGINSVSYDVVPYSEILDRCLNLAEEHLEQFSRSPHVHLARFYQFYILCEQGRLARVEQLAERYTVEAQATLLEGVGVLAGPWPHTFLLNLLPPTEVPQLDVEIGRRRPVQWQLRLTDVAVRCLRCAIDALARHDGRPPLMRIAANWRRITSMTFEYASFQPELRATCLRHCQDYAAFLETNGPPLTSSRVVAPLLNSVWNMAVTLAVYTDGAAEETRKWAWLAEKLRSIAPELQQDYEVGLQNILATF